MVWRWLTALVVVTLGASTLTTTGAAYAADEPPAKVKRAKVKAAGLSVAYPSDWVRIEFTDEDLESFGEVADDENPELSESVSELDSSEIKLHAQDPLDGDSVGVYAQSGALVGGKKFVRAMLEAQLAGAPGFEVVRMRDVKVGDKRGVRADYRYELVVEDGSVPIYEIGVFLPIGDGKVATVNIAVDDEPADVATADKVARSIRPL